MYADMHIYAKCELTNSELSTCDWSTRRNVNTKCNSNKECKHQQTQNVFVSSVQDYELQFNKYITVIPVMLQNLDIFQG